MIDMEYFVSLEDVNALFRPLSSTEEDRAVALIPVVCDTLRQEAANVGKDLDTMLESGKLKENVVKSVCVDIIARTLMTSTNSEPMTQISQSALGYTVSGTFLSPGGGLFIKKSELARLGLRRQKVGVIDLCP